MSSQLTGVLTALATPFTAAGGIDEPALRALVDRSIAGGVDGVVACGSTGEFAALSSNERRLVVQTVVEHTAGRVPVVAQTGATSTAEAIENSLHAQIVALTCSCWWPPTTSRSPWPRPPVLPRRGRSG